MQGSRFINGPAASTPATPTTAGVSPTPAFATLKSDSYTYWRRRALKRHFEALSDGLNQVAKECPAVYDSLLPSAELVLNLSETTIPTQSLCGVYLPQPDTAFRGEILVDGESVLRTSNSYPINTSQDVNENETPAMDQAVYVDTSLVEHLRQHAAFRPRNVELLSSLKTRAMQYVKSYVNSESWKTHQITMAVALSFEPSAQELLALSHIRSPIVAAKWAHVNDILSGGNSDPSDFKAVKPALVTRLLNWVYSPKQKLPGRLKAKV